MATYNPDDEFEDYETSPTSSSLVVEYREADYLKTEREINERFADIERRVKYYDTSKDEYSSDRSCFPAIWRRVRRAGNRLRRAFRPRRSESRRQPISSKGLPRDVVTVDEVIELSEMPPSTSRELHSPVPGSTAGPSSSKQRRPSLTIEDLPNQWYFQFTRDINARPTLGDEDENRALFHAENFKSAFKFDWMQRIRFYDEDYPNITKVFDYEIFCFCVYINPYRQVVRYAQRDDEGEILPPVREYFVKLETHADYLVITNPGDKWTFQCVYARQFDYEASTVCVITWPFEQFTYIIPIVGKKLHVIAKSGHYVAVVLLPTEDYGNRLIEDDFHFNEENVPSDVNATLVRAGERVDIIIRTVDVPQYFKVEERAPEGSVYSTTELVFIRGIESE